MNRNALLESLQGKRIGLVACTAIEADITSALKEARTAFAVIPANSVDSAEAVIDRFDALVLGVGDESAESDWHRPEALRNQTLPLLLAGAPEAIYCRQTLQSIADDVILAPFSARELLFRLYRITGGKCASRVTVVRSGKPVILVADDDINVRNYLKAVFSNLNVEVHFASNGVSALAAARQLLPDLLLLDIGLPIMSGLEVLHRLRSDPGTSYIATILVTASSDPSDVQTSASLGVSDYILKPFGHLDLVRKLKILLPIQSPLRDAQAAN